MLNNVFNSDSTFLILIGNSLNIVNALLALSWQFFLVILQQFVVLFFVDGGADYGEEEKQLGEGSVLQSEEEDHRSTAKCWDQH